MRSPRHPLKGAPRDDSCCRHAGGTIQQFDKSEFDCGSALPSDTHWREYYRQGSRRIVGGDSPLNRNLTVAVGLPGEFN